jgi:hypothetical protein
MINSDPLKPQVALLAKVASLLVHLDEGNIRNGHPFDWTAAKTLWEDDEVQAWLRGMQKLSLAPLKRNGR